MIHGAIIYVLLIFPKLLKEILRRCLLMSAEQTKNRDLFLKFCFIYFLNHILIVLGVNEEIVDVLPSEEITFKVMSKKKVFNSFLDFKVLTKSGKILIFEFKKHALRRADMKQAFDYYIGEFANTDRVVELIFIVLSDKGLIKEYGEAQLKFFPVIVKTKKIKKQKDLKVIRNKFKREKMLTIAECSLMIALPLFDVGESESVIVEEICKYIKYKKNCIPEEKFDEIIIAMYLNILEYIDDDKQEELLEMINMAETVKGLVERIKAEGIAEGKVEERKNIIGRILDFHSLEETAKILRMDEMEILRIIDK